MPPDARDIALTRGLLMALSREPDGHFTPSWLRVIVASVLTLGVWPVASLAYRFWRYQKAEWLLLEHYSGWLTERWGDDAALLVRMTEKGKKQMLGPGTVWFGLAAAIGSIVTTIWVAADVWLSEPAGMARMVLTPPLMSGGVSLLWQFLLAWSAVSGIGLIGQQRVRVQSWQRAASRAFVDRGHRPLPAVGYGPALIAVLILVFGMFAVPACLLAPLGVAWVMRQHVYSLVGLRQTLAARMLEVVDSRDGYRMEYDVEPLEAAEPAEVAAT